MRAARCCRTSAPMPGPSRIACSCWRQRARTQVCCSCSSRIRACRPTNRWLGVVTERGAVSLSRRTEALDTLPWPAGMSRAWRELAVSILHEGVLKPLCDITDTKLDAKTHVDYTADQAEAVRLARAGRYQAAFLIAPTTVDELQAVVRGGEVLPQKSTHFYPKLLDGLVFSRI